MSAFQVRSMHCRRCDKKVTRFERHDIWTDMCVPCGDIAHKEYVAAHTSKPKKAAKKGKVKDKAAEPTMTRTSAHANCTHPKTPAARAECRKARQAAAA